MSKSVPARSGRPNRAQAACEIKEAAMPIRAKPDAVHSILRIRCIEILGSDAKTIETGDRGLV